MFVKRVAENNVIFGDVLFLFHQHRQELRHTKWIITRSFLPAVTLWKARKTFRRSLP